MPAADAIKVTRRPRRNLLRDFYNGTSGSSGPASLKAASHEKAPPAAAVTHETPTRSGTTRACPPSAITM